VQVTGMPAMQGAHSETDAESWKLVSYVRSFRAPTHQEAVLQKK
jgi:hypothetical protein